MALSSTLILLLVLLALAAKSSAGAIPDAGWGLAHIGRSGFRAGLVGEYVDEDEELGLESESARRSLRGGSRAGRRYISYDALKKNRVPCSRRGQSYYNCQSQGRANPYKRGCSAITRCARDLS